MLSKLQLKKWLKRPIFIVLVLVLVLANLAFIPRVFAGTLTNTSIIELGGASNVNPMIASDGQSLALEFTTSGAVSSGSYNITLAFPGSFTVNATQSISNTGCTALTGASAGLPGTLAASGSGTTITIAMSGSDALSATTSYCTELTSTTAVTNPAAGSYSVTVNDSVDSNTVSLDVLSSGGNAYNVTATVAPTFTMSLSGTTDALGTLSSSATTTTTGITTTINTNAASGWFVWAKDLNAGLTSASTSTTIGTVTVGTPFTFTSNTGAKNYGICASADNITAYACTGTSPPTTGSGLSNTAYTEIATNGAPASAVTFVTHELANIAATTPAATDYADTITEIGAGSF